jgi:uncharacterized protein (DUF2147 family)
MLKQVSFVLFIFAGIALNVYASQHSDDVLGVWLSMEKTSKIKIYKCGNDGTKYCGKIVWLKRDKEEDGSPRVDKNNPDSKKRKRPLQDLVILKLFEYDSKNKEWNNGSIYDPYTGLTYKCYLKKSGQILKIRGYFGVSAIGRTAEWTKSE